LIFQELLCPALPAAFKKLTASRWFDFSRIVCPALPAAFKKADGVASL
jgi:hypothetical protein